MHQIKGKLLWAKAVNPPSFARKKPKASGAKAKGLQYESKIKKILGKRAIKGQWWKGQDESGEFICQTDLLVATASGKVLVIECKYTWTIEAELQLGGLYLPVVEKAVSRPAIGVQVCKILTAESKNVVSTLEEAIKLAESGVRFPTWHCLGT